MKKHPEQLAPSDGELFRQALEGVTPIASPNRIPRPPPPKYIPARTAPRCAPAISDSFSDHNTGEVAATSFLRPGLNLMTLRKLRRGQWPVQDAIDLHGLSSDEARRLLLQFLHHATHNDLRCINVIHGKGWRAEGGEGILKVRVRNWLTQHPQVLAFCEAPANAGGGGAVWVLLKSVRQENRPSD